MDFYEEVRVMGGTRRHKAFLAVERTSQRYFVLKKYSPGHNIPPWLWTSLTGLKDLQAHPTLLSVVAVSVYGASVSVALEYADGGGLDQWLDPRQAERLDEAFILRILHQMASALAFLHSRNIVHGAVRVKNMFLFGPHSDLKLGDLLDLPAAAQAPYSPTRAEDVRALGSAVHELCTYPLPKQSKKGNYQQVLPNSGQWRINSEELKNLILKMMNSQGENSLSAETILNSELLSWLEPMIPPLDPGNEYEFPQPSLLLPRKSPSAQQIQDFLVKLLGADRYVEAYIVVQRVMKDPSQVHYLSTPLSSSLLSVLSKEEVNAVLLLLKLLYVREAEGK